MVVASRLGIASVDTLRQMVDGDELYDWMALAMEQGWWVPPSDERRAEDPVKAIEQWLTAS